MRIEKYISTAEDYLTIGSAFPFIGIAPAVIKVGMGGAQCFSGLLCSIIFSTLSLNNSSYASLRNRSISHLTHGAANMVAGAVEGIPFVGFVIFLVKAIKSKVVGKEIQEIDRIAANMRKTVSETSSFYHALDGTTYQQPPRNYVLVSPNNFKLLGYKILQEDPAETYYQEQTAFYRSLTSSEPIDPTTFVFCADKVRFQKNHANARFYDAHWGPILLI